MNLFRSTLNTIGGDYMIIYKATNKVNGKVYIGKTKQRFSKRKTEHKTTALRTDKDTVFCRAIRKHGWDSIEWEVIDTASSMVELSEKEKYWVAYFDSYHNGYNATLGGDGTWGYILTEETKKKISKANKGKLAGEKSPFWGRKLTAEQKKHLNNPKTDEHKLNLAITRGSKPFLVFTLDGEFVGEWINRCDCCIKLNLVRSSVNAKLNKYKSCYIEDYIFIFKEHYTDQLLLDRVDKAKYRRHINRDSKLTIEQVIEIKTLLAQTKISMRKIGKMFGVSPSTIRDILSGKLWKNVEAENDEEIRKSRTLLTDAEVREIKFLLAEKKLTYKQIGEKFGASRSTIGAIRTGEQYSHVKTEYDKAITGRQLTIEQVRETKILLREGKLTHKQISERFGVSRATIGNINAGKSWSHINI